MEEPKNPDTCNVYNIYKLLATAEQIDEMRQNYLGGNYGYGHAKQALFELIITKYKNEREAFTNYMNKPDLLEEKLQAGEEKARVIGLEVLSKVKKTLGY